MPETGQPGGGGVRRSSETQGGQMAAGSRGPFVKVLSLGTYAGNVSKVVKCPMGVRWNLIAAYMILDTDATVANRVNAIELLDANANSLGLIFTGTTTAANLVAYDTLSSSEAATVTLYSPIPLVDGMGLYFYTGAGVAGDTVTVRVVVMEWKL